jgi:hypothetical protein
MRKLVFGFMLASAAVLLGALPVLADGFPPVG